FRVRLHHKDLGIALQTGREVSLHLRGTALAAELLKTLVAQGDGDLDHSALALMVEQNGGSEAS
ncbi:MAG: NAD-binding protein, partial [Fidelibacterota bacterium]